MRSIPVVLVALCVSVAAISSTPHDNSNVARHNRLSSRVAGSSLIVRAEEGRKCRKGPRVKKPANSGEKAASTEPKKNDSEKPAKPSNANNDTKNNFSGGGAGLLQASGACGASRATKTISKTGGPNGAADWLTCGINGGGWNPPYVRIENLVTVPLGAALQDPASPFHACQKYKGLFEQYGNEFGIPPIMLTAFALQESSCNAATQGQGGEQGLMQITQEKCAGAPGGDCKAPWFNIRTAARYFKQTLNEVDGNVIIAVGRYNGWSKGLTIGKATAARHSNCCRCQNNLDYLHEYFNGWLQNRDAYKYNLGTYNNLDVCG